MICQGASTHTRHILDTVLDTHRHFDTVSTDTTLDTASTLLRHSSTPTLQTVRVDHCPLSHSGRWRPTLPTGSGAGGPHLSGECTERRAPSPHCPLRWGQWAHTQSGFLCLKAIFSAALRVKSLQHAFLYTIRLPNSAFHILPHPSLASLSDSYGFWIFWERLEVVLRFRAFHCIHCPLGVGPEAHTVH